jgi:fatty acid desaturase
MNTIANTSTDRSRTIEWPTIALVILTYGVLISLVWFHAQIPWWVMLPVGAFFATLHSSLQHEVLHGHPTRNRVVNEMLVFLTPTMWLPFRRYRETHLTHHNDLHLTDPERDPESYYDLPETWARRGGLQRIIFAFNHTLFGRMLIGPAVSIVRFWSADIASIFQGHTNRTGCWLLFFLSCSITIYFVTQVCGMPFWKYYVLIAYPGISLALIRSYCEHQATPDLGTRTIVVEASPFWSLIFLNNNLHIAHHDRPSMPWYKLPAYYRQNRDSFLARNDHYVMKGYREIFMRYFFSAKEPIPYPDMTWLKR